MKARNLFLTAVLVLGLLTTLSGPVVAEEPTPPKKPIGAQAVVGTAFTYQGQLKQGGAPVSGTCDARFSLYDAASAGTPVGGTLIQTIAITNGLFTTQLDFGEGLFTGEARWLEVSIRCPAGSGDYTILSPRQALTPAPYALALPGLWTQQNATSPNLIGGYSGNSVSTGVVGGTVGGGGVSGGANAVTDNYGTVGGGSGNQAGDNAGTAYDRAYATVGGGYGNIANGYGATIGGGYENTASSSFATVAGGNTITASGTYATVGGGYGNTASGDLATIGGGEGNTVTATHASIGGGRGNTAGGGYATVGGGWANTASGYYATVGGGLYNTASGTSATVGGGYYNTASGNYATVAGGAYSFASGPWSFAAGFGTRANHQGAFVWGDTSTTVPVASTGNDQFIVRASGGIWLGTTSSPSIPSGRFINTDTGGYLSTGGVWTDASSRAYKEDIAPLTTAQARETLAGLEPVTFRHKGEEEERYVGFIAEDVPDLVATADRKGLSAMDIVAVLTRVVQEQQRDLAEQSAQIAALEARLAALEALVAKLAQGQGAGGGR